MRRKKGSLLIVAAVSVDNDSVGLLRTAPFFLRFRPRPSIAPALSEFIDVEPHAAAAVLIQFVAPLRHDGKKFPVRYTTRPGPLVHSEMRHKEGAERELAAAM
jgi:hypothetical protein